MLEGRECWRFAKFILQFAGHEILSLALPLLPYLPLHTALSGLRKQFRNDFFKLASFPDLNVATEFVSLQVSV
jgi:hypothetical protein